MADASEPNAAHARLEQELARLRTERREQAAGLAGEDPEDPVVGDRGDQAQALEGDADLARLDRRIDELQHLIATPDAADEEVGLPDGAVVTLRFPGGDVTTFRVVAIVEEAGEDEVLTSDSPLGRALAGRHPGDTITYPGPDGDLNAEVVDLKPPTGQRSP